MRRLAAVDWLLIGTLLPICLFGVVMTVIHGVRGDFVLLSGWGRLAYGKRRAAH